jgi:DNA-binding MarR family transcriptional regulator
VRVSNVLDRFRQGGGNRQRAIREIGLELPKRRTETVSELRAGIAQLEGDAGEFDRGYREAVLDLLAAYEAAIARDGDLDEILQTLHTRANWEETLTVLATGTKRPADIVNELGVDAAVVSRVLTALSELELVEVLPMAEGQDRRSKFFRLTLKGEQLVQRLERPEPMTVEPLVRAAATFFAELATRRRVIRSELETDVRRVLKGRVHQVRRVVAALVSVAKEFSLVHENHEENLLIAAEMTAQNRLAQELENHIVGGTSSPTVADLIERVPKNCEVLVRCAKLRDTWNQVLVEKFVEYPAARTIDPQDISAEKLIPNPSGKFALIYDNATLFMTDVKTENAAMLDLQQRATVRVCLGSAYARVPEGWQLMQVTESY